MPPADAEFPDGRRQVSEARYHANAKSVVVAYLLWFFLGGFGLHRFYLGRVMSGIFMFIFWGVGTFLTFILFGFPIFLAPWAIWWFVDAFLIPGMVTGENNAVVDRIEGRA